jgi:hypothetical protein
MTILLINATILFVLTLVTTVNNVLMVTMVHLLPCYLGYQHYQCSCG